MVRRIGKLQALAADEDMYDAGVSSVVALELLLELEERSASACPTSGSWPAGPRGRSSI